MSRHLLLHSFSPLWVLAKPQTSMSQALHCFATLHPHLASLPTLPPQEFAFPLWESEQGLRYNVPYAIERSYL